MALINFLIFFQKNTQNSLPHENNPTIFRSFLWHNTPTTNIHRFRQFRRRNIPFSEKLWNGRPRGIHIVDFRFRFFHIKTIT